MSRPPVYGDRVQTGFRCPADLLAEARQSAAAHDVSFNLWLEQAIRRHLDQLDARPVDTPTPWDWNT